MEPSGPLSQAIDCFWGVELSVKNKTHLFEEEGEEDLETVLELRQACLGADAKEGRNVVQVTSQNEDDEPVTHTLLSMRVGGTEMAPLFVTLRPPSKLELVKGNGPIHILGTTITNIGDLSDDDEDEEEEEETVPDDVPVKKGKKRSASPVKNPTKIARMINAEAEEDSDEEEEDDEDEEEGSDEDEEDGEDEEELERFQKPAVTKKGAKKATHVEEMDDDESMSDEDVDEGESEDDEEMEIPPPKSKKQSQPKFKTPQAQKSTPKSSLKSPMSAPKPKKGSEKKPAGKPTVALSINEIKKKLVTSPNLPKKLDKFNNYMSNNFKVSDASVKKQLWEFVQKSKK